jgi:hypothetical protein
MKTRALTLASAAVLGALAVAGGCTDNRASIQVQGICYPTDGCSFGSTCDQYFGGTAGVVGPGTLVLYVQVENQLTSNENLPLGRLNTNDAHVTEIRVDYEGGQTGTTYAGANSWIPAGGSTIVPLGFGIAGAGEILARVRLSGYYDHGAHFETGEFPVSIYSGAGACPATCAGATETCPPGGAGQCPVFCAAGGSTPSTYTVGGTISGLTGSGLILSTPGYADVSVPAAGTSFSFAGLPDGTAYDVTVRAQPAGQTCTVTPGTGTGTVSGANVTSVRITCA